MSLLKDTITRRDELLQKVEDLQNKQAREREEKMLALAERDKSTLTIDELTELNAYEGLVLREAQRAQNELKALEGGTSEAKVEGARAVHA